MGFFNFLKPKTNNLEYTIDYNIEDWIPSQKYYEYDGYLSLKNYLIQENIPQFDIIKIMGAKDPFDSFNMRIMDLDGSDMRYVFDKQIANFRRRVVLWAIRECDIYGTSENICMYFLYKIGQVFQWNMFEGISMNKQGQKQLLDICANNKYKDIITLFGQDVLTAFAFAHSHSIVDLTTAIRYGLDFIANNSKNTNSGHGNLYNAFGKETIEAIIYKVFEAAYRINEFEFNKIFYISLMHENMNTKQDIEVMYPFNSEELRYCGNQIVNKKHETFYYLNSKHFEKCKQYLDILREVYISSKAIYPLIKTPIYENENLCLMQGRVDGMISSSLFFVHQFTETQKISKYPSSVSLRFKNDQCLNNNRLYFNKNGELKRVETYYNTYSVIALIEKSQVKISYIYKHDDLGKKKKIYSS